VGEKRFSLEGGQGSMDAFVVSEKRETPQSIQYRKGIEQIAALTAYDYSMAKLLDAAGVHLLLVGDSLGMVILGYPDTTQVTLDEMEHHVRAVARANPRGLIIADLPFKSYETPQQAVLSAKRLIDAGAEGVKAEGGQKILPQVESIISAGISFLGHIGMLPQNVVEEGGYKIKGCDNEEKDALLADALALTQAGAFGLVLELVNAQLAHAISQSVEIPTIGIGSGNDCDGQILVTTDLLGTSPDFIPKHVRPELLLRDNMVGMLRDWKESLTNRK
jgi:3-methyl-2-oxobutanoate hydroxymethyltransferase